MPLDAGPDSQEFVANGEGLGPVSGRKPCDFWMSFGTIGENGEAPQIQIYEQFSNSNVVRRVIREAGDR